MSLLQQMKEEAHIEKKDRSVIGPYKAAFAGDTILLLDQSADIEEGDTILRKLPSGRDERSLITKATFFNRGVGGTGPHYQLKFRKDGESEMQKSHTITINGAQSVQIGDYNTQSIVNSFEALVKKIEAADSTPEQKEEAKGILRKLLEHPLVVTVLGAAVGSVF